MRREYEIHWEKKNLSVRYNISVYFLTLGKYLINLQYELAIYHIFNPK